MSSSKIFKKELLWGIGALGLLVVTLCPSAVWAQGAAPAATPDLAAQVAEINSTLASNKVALDTVWVLITAFLVFWMNAGFALVESGMCRVKNAVNILSKNFIVFALSSLAFYFVGWGLMFGDGNGILGLKGLFYDWWRG